MSKILFATMTLLFVSISVFAQSQLGGAISTSDCGTVAHLYRIEQINTE